MKTLVIVALALVATAFAYEVEDIPEFMKERLDKLVAMREQWEQKWLSMTADEREFYEQMIYDRLAHIPENVRHRIHRRIAAMAPEDQTKLRDYLYQRFPELQSVVEAKEGVDEIDAIIESLPEMLREKISDFISIRFAPAAAYENVDDADFIDFPDIPALIEVPTQGEGVPYSEQGLEEEAKEKIDGFLLKREDWKRRWENLPEEKREAFEKYMKAKMNS